MAERTQAVRRGDDDTLRPTIGVAAVDDKARDHLRLAARRVATGSHWSFHLRFPQSSSPSRFVAGAARFFILS